VVVAEKQSLGAMVSGVTEDLSTLLRGEIELAKTELRDSAQTAARGGGMLAAAGVVAFLTVVFLLVTIAYVLVQLGLPVWAGFGIVTLALAIVATVLGLLGRKQLEQVKGLERTPASIEKTKAMLTGKPLPEPALPDLPQPS
jgi:Putative Actinobacterial Holin-X, holin superfamily III